MCMCFVCLASRMSLTKAFSAPERHYHHARHVDCRLQGRQCADGPEHLVPARPGQAKPWRAPGFPENLILRKEPGEDRNARNGKPARQHSRESYRHVLLQAAHAPHILLMMHAVDYRAGTEEQKRFEKCVGNNVEYCSNERADAACQEHVPEL